MSRRMFWWWRMKISTAMNTASTTIGRPALRKRIDGRRAAAAVRAASDEKRNSAPWRSRWRRPDAHRPRQRQQHAEEGRHALAALKSSHTGNRWPTKAAPPATAAQACGFAAGSSFKAMKKAMRPADRALAAVADQGDQRQVPPAGAQDVGRADIARADCRCRRRRPGEWRSRRRGSCPGDSRRRRRRRDPVVPGDHLGIPPALAYLADWAGDLATSRMMRPENRLTPPPASPLIAAKGR